MTTEATTIGTFPEGSQPNAGIDTTVKRTSTDINQPSSLNLPEGTRLCSVMGISLASYIGGPLAGCYLLRRNFKLLGQTDKAKKTLFWGLIGSAIFIILIAIVSVTSLSVYIEKVPNILFPILYSSIIVSFASQYQKPAIQQAKAEGYKRYSKLKILGVMILSSIVYLIAFFIIGTAVTFLLDLMVIIDLNTM